MKNLNCILAIVVTLFFLTPLSASDMNIFGLGLFDFNKKMNEAIDLRFERRLDKEIFNLGPKEQKFYIFKPFYGLEGTSDNALYVLGGFYIEDKFSEKIFVTPSIGVGAFSKGTGKDLGNVLEFRSSIEFSYQLKNNNRIGISLSHISNASTGNKNPGTEVFSLSFQRPF